MKEVGNTKARLKIDLKPYKDPLFEDCVRVLGESFISNPMHIRVFGDKVLERNKAFFSIGLQSFKGKRIVAEVDGKVAGFIHWVESHRCQFSLREKLFTMPAMIGALGLTATIDVSRWLNTWERCELQCDHLHLGPIGVHPALQGHGIGAALMNRYCMQADQLNLIGYLETDKPENIAFYERFGFIVFEEISVFGIPNFLMVRPKATGVRS